MKMAAINTNTSLNLYRIMEKYVEYIEQLNLNLEKDTDRSVFFQEMIEMYQVLSELTGTKEKELTEEKMNSLVMSLAYDIFFEIRKDAYFIGMRNAVKILVWRSGYLFAMSPNILNDELTAKLTTLLVTLIHYDQKKYQKPDMELFEKIMSTYAGLDEWASCEVTEKITEQFGTKSIYMAAYAKKSKVCSFGHPVDSSIIKILDNSMVNGIFRSYVNINADAYMGQILATGITVNEQNYPEINTIVDECVKTLQIQRPYVVVSSQPGINAMTFGSDEEPYLVLTSLLVKIMNQDQLRFVIGHECGHIAMGHVMYHSAVSILSLIGTKSLLIGKAAVYALNAWSRRSEITADRAGLICCGNVDTARKALIQLECAYRNADDFDIDAYTQNSKDYLSKGLLRKIGEYKSSHPLTPKRIEAITEFAKSSKYYEAMMLPAPKDAVTDEKLTNKVEEILSVL